MGSTACYKCDAEPNLPQFPVHIRNSEKYQVQIFMIYLQILLEPFGNEKEILDLMEFYISKAKINKEKVKTMKAGKKKKYLKKSWNISDLKSWFHERETLLKCFPPKNNNWNKIR